MTKDPAVLIAEGNAKIAHRAKRFQIRIVREKLRDIIGNVDQLCFFYYRLARRSRKIVLIIRDKFAVKPERERAQPVCFFDKLRYPRTISIQRCREAFDQCIVKAGSGFGGSSLYDQTRCLIDVEVLKDSLAVQVVSAYMVGNSGAAALDFSRGSLGLRYYRLMLSRAIQFASKNWSIPVEDLELSIEPIGGGLESRVVRAALHSPKAKDSRTNTFVVKELRGLQRRETQIYRELWRRSTSPPAVRLLGTEATEEADYLYLEEVTQQSTWPWKQSVSSIAVCHALARLHDSEPCHRRRLIDWDYESDLLKSADETLTVAVDARDKAGVRYWRRIGDLRRVVAALPKLRSVLVQAPTFIHGDVHPGNVIVRACKKGEIAFIDWARARIGSPLEDLASWLHSLGCWEPEARRRHDTLLRAYLEARSPQQTITTELRRMYWYASASNGLSGAIRYHLLVLNDPASSIEMTSNSALALRAWERVIRRVAAILATNRRH